MVRTPDKETVFNCIFYTFLTFVIILAAELKKFKIDFENGPLFLFLFKIYKQVTKICEILLQGYLVLKN